MLGDAVHRYFEVQGHYPATLSDLDDVGALEDLKGLEVIPQDAWGHAFVYHHDEAGFQIVSHGADGKVGGKHLDADLDVNHLSQK
ncbi:type II secretion system protein GspG [bacterium AH-315-F18]|nr:type II secretion system protein GspG [bacterium AH-315-F18]